MNGEIINADSMQIYKEFGVMTAKPGDETSVVRHHLYDYVDVNNLEYSVIDYMRDF